MPANVDQALTRRTSLLALLLGLGGVALGAAATVRGGGTTFFAAVALVLLGWAASRWRPDRTFLIALGVAMLLLVPARYRVEPLGSAGTPASLLGLFALVVWGLGLVSGRPRLTRGTGRIRTLALLLVASVLVSYVCAGYRSPDEVLARAADRGVMTIAATLSLMLLVGESVRGRTAIRRVVAVIAASGGVVALLGVLQFALGIDVAGLIEPPGFTYAAVVYDDSRAGFARIVSTVSHPIELAVVLVMMLPLVLWLFFSSTGRARIGWAVCFAVTAAAVPMTVSRTGVAGLAVALLVLVPSWTWRRRLRVGAVGLVGLVAFSVVVPGLLGTLRAMLFDPGADPSLVSREVGRERALAAIGDHPLFGLGFGTYLPERFGYLDNQLLGTLVETGVLGLLAFAALLGGVALFGVQVVRRSVGCESQTDRALAVALLAALAVSVSTWATYDALSFPTVRGLTFVLLGLVVALWRTTADEPVPGRPPAAAAEDPGSTLHPHDVLTGER